MEDYQFNQFIKLNKGFIFHKDSPYTSFKTVLLRYLPIKNIYDH